MGDVVIIGGGVTGIQAALDQYGKNHEEGNNEKRGANNAEIVSGLAH